MNQIPELKHPLISNKTAFLTIGCLEASWSPLVPYVKHAFSLSEGSLGLLLLASGLGSICALPVAGIICTRYGAKRTVWASAVVMAATLLAISTLVSAWLTAVMLFLFGICTILIDVAANVNGIAVEHLSGRHLMSGFHGGYSFGTLLGALLMSSFLTMGLIPLWAVAITAALTLLAIVLGARGLLTRSMLAQINGPAARPETEKRHHRFYIPPQVIVIGIICFIMYSSEGAVLSWGAVFAHQERGIDMRYAGFFYVAFAVMMTVMRFLGDRLVNRFGQRKVVSMGALGLSCGYAVTALVPYAWATVAGLALMGLGAANVVPQLVSLAGNIKGIAVQNAVSVVNALGYTGVLVGPVAIGFIADHLGLPASFLCISVCCLLASVLAYAVFTSVYKQQMKDA